MKIKPQYKSLLREKGMSVTYSKSLRQLTTTLLMQPPVIIVTGVRLKPLNAEGQKNKIMKKGFREVVVDCKPELVVNRVKDLNEMCDVQNVRVFGYAKNHISFFAKKDMIRKIIETLALEIDTIWALEHLYK